MIFDYFLFDLDNCLLQYPNYIEYLDYVLVESLKKNSVKVPNHKERKKVFSAEEDYNDLLKQWSIFDYELFWKHFSEIDFEYRKKLIEKKEIFLFNNVENVLSQLVDRNKKLALISNSPGYIVDYIVNKFKLSSFFDEILTIDYERDQNLAKPSPDGIISILKKLNYSHKNSNAIMIGDSIVDIIAAKKANIYACLVNRESNESSKYYEDWEYLPDYIIKRLHELLEL